MKTLHIVNRSPEHPSTMARCLRFSSKNDSLLLIEDGVYFALASTLSKIKQSLDALNISLYALEEDLIARGIQADKSIQTVSYDGFVKLTATHSKSSSWY